MSGSICCQPKMQGNYPSVAKACTFASRKGRPNRFYALEQKANKTPEVRGMRTRKRAQVVLPEARIRAVPARAPRRERPTSGCGQTGRSLTRAETRTRKKKEE